MKAYKYNFSITAASQEDANKKMKALSVIASKLSTQELEKIAQVINDPVQLALIKSRLG